MQTAKTAGEAAYYGWAKGAAPDIPVFPWDELADEEKCGWESAAANAIEFWERGRR